MKGYESSKPKLKVMFGIVIFLLVLWIVHLLFAPLAYFAVRKACSEEGGLRLTEHPVAESYWHAGREWTEGILDGDCDRCAEQVAAKQFLYVDFQTPPIRDGSPATFVQYRLEPTGHPNCDSSTSRVQPPSGMCVAVVPIQGAPQDKYKYQSRFLRTTTWFGVPIRELRRTLIEVVGGRTIAVDRYFTYATLLERRGKFAPSYKCEGASGPYGRESQFFEAVFGKFRDRTNNIERGSP
jgi:hypothetical protein